MATIASVGSSISISSANRTQYKPGAVVPMRRSRKMSREAGRGIEILGHAIDYLADEFALECMSAQLRRHPGPNPHIAAIELLMACNREIYFSCPEIPSLGERFSRMLRSVFHMQAT